MQFVSSYWFVQATFTRRIQLTKIPSLHPRWRQQYSTFPTISRAVMAPNAVGNLVNPPWLVPGHNAWQLTASSLVALQSIPVLYAGCVMHKWSINSAF